MAILALDLSLNGSGIAVLGVRGDKVEIIHTELVDNKKVKRESEKLDKIQMALRTALTGFRIDSVVREKGFSRFPATTQKLFKVVGVSDLVAYVNGHEVVAEIPPTTVKSKLAGSGKAEKAQVQEAVREYLIPEQEGYEFASDDISDAVAVGITYLLQQGQELRRG